MRVRSLALVLCAALLGGGWTVGAGPTTPRTDFGGWTVSVSVESPELWPVVVSAGPLRPVPQNDAHPWIEHELVFENRGNRPVTFADTRKSAFLGSARHPVLLAADQGCGYGFRHPGAPIEAGVCLAYLDRLVVKAHGSESRTITLLKGLRGMDRLTPGTYVFTKPIRFGGRSAVIRVVYAIRSTR